MGLATRWGAPPELARELFVAIVAAYGEPGRSYHTLDHIAAVLATIERFGPGRDPDALKLAAWYHDVVYDSRSADNEERSAEWARADLRRLGAPDPLIDRVVGLVLATKEHRVAHAKARDQCGDPDDGRACADRDRGVPQCCLHDEFRLLASTFGGS